MKLTKNYLDSLTDEKLEREIKTHRQAIADIVKDHNESLLFEFEEALEYLMNEKNKRQAQNEQST